MRCHSEIGNNPILCIIEVLLDINSESAGYFDCASKQLNKRIRMKHLMIEIN